MAKIIKRTWTSRGPSGHKVKRVSYGFTVQVDGKQERRFSAEWEDRERAEDELAKFRLNRDKPKVRPLTFGEAATRYEQAKARKKTLAADRLILRRLLAHFGADTRLDKLTAEAISLYRDGRLSTPSERRKDAEGKPTLLEASTVNRDLACLRCLLQLAHDEWGALAVVPRIRLEKEPEGRIRWLEADEEARLRAACGMIDSKRLAEKLPAVHLAEIVCVALETGMRQGEIMGLTWDRVDLSRGVLRLEITKSGKRREVPMRDVVDQLLAAKPEASRQGRVWPVEWPRGPWEDAVAEAKLDNFHFHDCRHHFASWFMMRGGGLQALQKILGHSGLAMTSKYAHLSPDYLRQEMARTAAPPTEPAVSTQLAHEASRADAASEK